MVAIGNDSWLVQSLCHLLDLVLCHGLRDIRRGYWRAVQKFSHSDTVRVIQSLKTVSTSLGRGTSLMQCRSTVCLTVSHVWPNLLRPESDRSHYCHQRSEFKLHMKYSFGGEMVKKIQNICKNHRIIKGILCCETRRSQNSH